MKVTNPYTLESYELKETINLEDLYHQAKSELKTWSSKSVAQRVEVIKQSLDKFPSQKIAELISQEMGKPIKQSRIEVERSIDECNYMLNNAENFLKSEKVESAEINFSPLGVIAVISPWNFPVLLPLRGIIPALLAGNTVIFKPSELSPKTGILISEIFANCPLFIAIGGKQLGAKLTQLPVNGIAFTGSTAVGKAIAKEASNSLKRILLELGGLDAAIVLEDADLKKSAANIVRTNARNSGQVCNSIKRVFVHKNLYSEFVREAQAESSKLIYGDPLDENTDLGPLVSEAQYKRVEMFLNDAILKGAKASTKEIEKKGFLFPQVILSDVPENALLLKEEPFGPLLPIMKFETEQEAIDLANNTNFGLTASVWTQDLARAKKIAKELDVGMVRHNTHAAMQSGIPWGGCKESGIGRMKTKEGLREFTNIKVIA